MQDPNEGISSRNPKPALRARYDRTIIFWSWLFPLTYLIHVAEEYWGGEGYPAYISRLRGVYMSPSWFLAAQGVGLILVTVGIILAWRFKFLTMMMVILGAVVTGNALTHTFTTLVTLEYEPGLLSSILIWIPLGVATTIRFKASINSRQYWSAIAIGLGINIVVGIVTWRGGSITL